MPLNITIVTYFPQSVVFGHIYYPINDDDNNLSLYHGNVPLDILFLWTLSLVTFNTTTNSLGIVLVMLNI